MNYTILKVNMEIINFDTKSKNIIGSILRINVNDDTHDFIINNFLGKGSVGQVYLLEEINTDKKLVVKISNINTRNDLIDEVKLIKHYFSKNKIISKNYPIYYGEFKNLVGVGIIYPYFGFYNLEKIKQIKYKINFKNNILIIKQIINQLINLQPILHCDLKPSNVVIDIINNNLVTTIIDFGLIKCESTENILSTNYITSPESILTLNENIDCIEGFILNKNQLLKSDYMGLFSVIINLFAKNNFWSIFTHYLSDGLRISPDFLLEQKAIDIFAYMWFKFSYKDIKQIEYIPLQRLIYKIQKKYPKIKDKEFLSFDLFFNRYIEKHLDKNSFDLSKLNEYKDFLKKIICFEENKRPELNELLLDIFLQN